MHAPRRRTVLIASGAAVLVLGVSVGIGLALRDDDAAAEPSPSASSPAASATPTPTDTPTGTASTPPAADPTDPGEGVTPAPTPAPTAAEPLPPATQPANVIVTFSGWNAGSAAAEMGGYVDAVTEVGGTCTLSLTQSGRSVTTVVDAVPDASTTSCGLLQIPRASLGAGTWQATLSYLSAASSGSAPTATIEVP